MSYGFDNKPVDVVQLPKAKRETTALPQNIGNVLQAGAGLGFVSRETSTRRKPGPRRTEHQDKITVTGPKRVIDRLKAYSDAIGGVSYCDAIEALLNAAEATKK